MPRFERMPNGQMIRVPDDISRRALNRVRSKYSGDNSESGDSEERTGFGRARTVSRQPSTGVQTRNVPRNAQEQEVRDRADAMGRGTGFSWDQALNYVNPATMLQSVNRATGGNLAGGLTANFDDELAGAASALGAVPEALREGSFSPIANEYRTEQQARDTVKKEFQRDNPGTATVAQMAGGAMLPFAGTGRSLYTGANALRGAGATGAARVVGRTAARMRRSGPVARGATVGAGMGAANAAGNSNDMSDMPGNAVLGAVTGGVLGGVLGGAIQGGSTAVRAIRDRRAARQGNEEVIRARAFERVGSLIDNIRNKDDKAATGSQLRNRIIGANRTGADTRVMDTSPGLRSEAAYLARDTNIPNSNRLQDLAEERILARQGRFTDQASKRSTTKGMDARNLRESVNASRKARGNLDYREGGPMDKPMQWTDEIQEFFMGAGPTTQRALKRAMSIMRDERRDPMELGINEQGVIEKLPSYRTLDYLKRGYDELIEQALGGNNPSRSKARRISDELSALKNFLIEQNDEYGAALAAQRDAFQKMRATEIGEKVFQSMKNRPREMYKELQELKGDYKDDARIGIIDALLNLETKADPINAMRAYMRTPAQRRVLEFAFGGKKQLESFEKYVENEVKASLSDRFVSSGRQSLTSTVQQAGMSQQDALNEIGGQAIKGYGFGGEVGLLANTVQGIKRAANARNPEVQNEIARILMSKGEDLERGLMEAARFFANRRQKDIARTTAGARAIATPFGASVGDN